MRLSLVIPVWNDRGGLTRLLSQVQQLGHFAEVIVADDASDQDVSPESLGFGEDRLGIPVRHLRAPVRRGAGGMRNLGLEHATGSHVIFFDSDDLFMPGMGTILGGIAHQEFDFCIFRHHDNRIKGRSGSFEGEERHWTSAGAEAAPLPLAHPEVLCRLSAYPWNKIYSTDFLRREGLRCTEIPVHNDLELHWTSFIAARRILCTTQVGAVHFVGEGGTRLTNRRSADRLRVFEALDAILDRLARTPGSERFAAPLMAFALQLLKWVGENLDASHRNDLAGMERAFFLNRISPSQMTLLAYADPGAAGRIVGKLRGERA